MFHYLMFASYILSFPNAKHGSENEALEDFFTAFYMQETCRYVIIIRICSSFDTPACKELPPNQSVRRDDLRI